MLVKLLLSVALATVPVLTFSQTIQMAQWPDGTKFAWQCQKGATGNVKFVVLMNDGKLYEGVVSCGQTL